MSQIVRCNRCPRCGGWLYVEADTQRLGDHYITCGCCGWEQYLGDIKSLEPLGPERAPNTTQTTAKITQGVGNGR